MTIQERIKQQIKNSMEKKGVSSTQMPEMQVLEGQYINSKAKSGK